MTSLLSYRASFVLALLTFPQVQSFVAGHSLHRLQEADFRMELLQAKLEIQERSVLQQAAGDGASIESDETLHGQQLSWDEAREKATAVVAQLTDAELHSLLRGQHFSAKGIPDEGYYIGNSPAIQRLGIPALKMQDAGQGFRDTEPGTEKTTTAWPCMLALASTWDDDLVGLIASAIANEFKGKGANVILGPSINVHRVARGGRNFEYLSGEDPYLGSRMSRAYVIGVQGQGVMAVAKHYAMNEQETNRMTMDAHVSRRVAMELYYPPFRAAARADVGAVMCAYNKVNGTYACQNPDMLSSDLRDTMGFHGFVMSDWLATHHSDSLSAGLDQEQPGVVKLPFVGEMIVLSDKALESVEHASKTAAAIHTLTAIFHLNLHDPVGCTPPACWDALWSDQTKASTLGHKHRDLALLSAQSAVTLLKNEKDTLPVTKDKVKKIAVLGWASSAEEHPYFVGDGSGYVMPDDSAKTPLQAITERASKAGIEILAPNSSDDLTEALVLAKAADLVIVVAGAPATEGRDRKDLSLQDDCDDLIAAVASETPTVVLMQSPGAVLTPWRDEVAGIANLFMGGVATGDAWANFLFGDSPPRGRLPIMMPASASDVIEIGQEEEVVYSEGLFTSYRSPHLKAAFPFGHGLSFTSFKYSNAREEPSSCPASSACVALDVKNSGARSGEEVVQAYLHFPEPTGDSEEWAKETPEMVLKGYKRTKVLEPQESQMLLFVFSQEDISLYSPEHGWVPQQKFDVRFGASSGDIRTTVSLQMP